MARLDLGGLRDLWYRIDDIFARLTEAIGSISFSGTTLSWSYASGGSAGSVDLNNTFATDAEAGHSLSFNQNNGNVTLNNVNGGNLNSVDLDTRYATRGQAGNKLGIDGRVITLYDVNGNSNGSVTVPAGPDVSGFVGRGSVFSSASASRSGDTVTITFYDANGKYKDNVSFSVA